MINNTDQPNGLLYAERLSSNRTTALFLALTLTFLLLFIWRMSTVGQNILTCMFLCFSIVFFFYVINYRALVIHISREYIRLKFGIFTWTETLGNIESCSLDEMLALMRFGGAGIHFMFIRRRYRVSFNFLEYPRLVIALRRKRGLVRDVSFSTQRPDEILRILRDLLGKNPARAAKTSGS